MGLDIVMYGKNNEIHKIEEIDYSLHEALFIKNNNWSSYLYLRQLSDYYLTDVTFDREEINKLIRDFKNIRMFIPNEYQSKLDKLVLLLEDLSIKSIHIGGD